ncbi:MAG: DUF1638 domain-containing protein [Ardenticatenaceae bacterium]|nr:DUF1638 domain-containing protein [Ardenticatenaceae bacterium]HBY93001.1 hypothetical protein [Chloroflexota bacterium]
MNRSSPRIALVLCGALAREVIDIVKRYEWDVALFGVAALDHMVPGRIGPDVECRLRELIPQFERVAVVYGDCGTGGRLDEVLNRYNVPRIAGPHCYEMYGGEVFDGLMDENPGTFFLTDFLCRQFEGTVRKGLGLDRFPELKDVYFGNYTRLVYLVQKEDQTLVAKARTIADLLGLTFEVRLTGYGRLEERLVALMAEIHADRYQPILPSASEEDFNGKLSDPVLVRHSRPSARERRQRPRECSSARSVPGSD